MFGRRRPEEEVPLRGELLGLESLEERAKTLAGVFTLARDSRAGGHDIRTRLDANLRVLREAYRILADDVRRGDAVDPAAEWLLDNFHLVESEARAVRHDLPSRYYQKLPKLAARELSGKARIHAMALELIRHGDGRLDAERLTRFVLAYQTVAPLTIGELWAWPSMLKLALLENLRILADGDPDRASRPAGGGRRARAAGRRRPSRAASRPASQRLRRAAPAADARIRPARLLAARPDGGGACRAGGTTSEDAVRAEYQRQATDQVSTGNTITSLRLCATLDWSRYVERVSLVEQILRRDPAAVYTRMDFQSRDRYRQAVEELAEPTGEAQVRVALRAVESARQAAERKGIGDADRARRSSPDRPGPARPRDRRGVHPSAWPKAPPVRLLPRDRGVPRRHRPPDRPRRLRGDRICPRLGRPRDGDGRGASRADPRERARGAHRPAPRRRARAAAAAPPPRSHRGRPRERPHDGGRAGAPRKREGRRAIFWSTWRCRRSATSTRTSTSRSSSDFKDATDADDGGRRRDPGRRRRRNRGPQQPPRARRQRPFLPLPPGAPVEPERGRVHGLGEEAGQARGVQPAPARRRATPASRCGWETCRSCRRCATSSRSTPTRGSRGAPRRR